MELAHDRDSSRTAIVSADLHIAPIWRTALLAPFTNIVAVFKFGAAPFLFTLLAQIVEYLTWTYGDVQLSALWRLLPLLVLYIPFNVGWTRLAVLGPRTVAGRGYFTFARREAGYLIATAAFFLAGMSIALPIELAITARRNFDHHLLVEAGTLLIAMVVALLICGVRLLFVFPAIATDSYRGIPSVWRQTRGHFEQLLALYAITRAPWFVAIELCDRLITPETFFPMRAALLTLEDLLALLSAAAGVAAIGLAYRKTLAQGR